MNVYVLFCLLSAFPSVSGKYHYDHSYECMKHCPPDSHHSCLPAIRDVGGGYSYVCAKCGDIINATKGPKLFNCSIPKVQCAKSDDQCIDVDSDGRYDLPNRTLACCHCPYVLTPNYRNKFLSHPSKEQCKDACTDEDGRCSQLETGCWVCIYSLWHMWSFWLLVVLPPPILFGSLVMAPFLVIACFNHKQRKQSQQNQH